MARLGRGKHRIPYYYQGQVADTGPDANVPVSDVGTSFEGGTTRAVLSATAQTGTGADTAQFTTPDTVENGVGVDSAVVTISGVVRTGSDTGHGTDFSDVQTTTPAPPVVTPGPEPGPVPLPPFTCGEFGKTLFREMEPVTYADAQNGDSLRHYLCSIGSQFEEAWTLARDIIIDGKRVPGWSIVVDLDRIPTKGLGWLAQFVGVSLDIALSDPLQRERIRATDGWKRGSVGAFMGAARQYLTGNRTVIFKERYTSAYHILVVTRAYETPDPDQVLAALTAQKPAGLILEYHTVNGRIYLEVKEQNANYTAAKAAYATYEAMRATRDIDVPPSSPLAPSETLTPTGTLAPGG